MARHDQSSAWYAGHGEAGGRWDLTRTIHLLEYRLTSEQRSLETWQLRLVLRTAYEERHAEPTQLPAIRQMCASTHARVLDLERELAEARVALRRRSSRQHR